MKYADVDILFASENSYLKSRAFKGFVERMSNDTETLVAELKSLIKELETQLTEMYFHPGHAIYLEDQTANPMFETGVYRIWSCCRKENIGCTYAKGKTKDDWEELQRRIEEKKAKLEELLGTISCHICAATGHKTNRCIGKSCHLCYRAIFHGRHICGFYHCDKCGEEGHEADTCDKRHCPICGYLNARHQTWVPCQGFVCSMCSYSYTEDGEPAEKKRGTYNAWTGKWDE
jgi:hypothetical protein